MIDSRKEKRLTEKKQTYSQGKTRRIEYVANIPRKGRRDKFIKKCLKVVP